MELLTLGEDKLVKISETISSVTQFRKIIRRDKDRFKKAAISEITFIYHFLNPRSPFFNYQKEVKLKACIKNSNLPEDFDYSKDKDILEAMNIYTEFLENEIPSLGLVKDSMKAVEAVRNYFRSLIDNGGRIEDADEGKKVLDMLTKIGNTSQALNEEYKRLQSEMSASSGLRGDSKKGWREDPK